MAKRKGGWLVWLLIIIIACVGAFVFFVYRNNRNEPQVQEPSGNTHVCFDVIEANIAYKQGSCTVDLVSGKIKTNAQVDKVFVNINGVGTQYLGFTVDQLHTAAGTYVLQTIDPTNSLCATGFANDATVTVDIYVEYGGRSYKVDTQEVQVKSAWTACY